MTRNPRGAASQQAILDAGLTILRERGAEAVSMRSIGEMLGRAHTGIGYYFGGETGALRRAVADYAMTSRDVRALARLILDNDPSIRKLSIEERRAIMSDVLR